MTRQCGRCMALMLALSALYVLAVRTRVGQETDAGAFSFLGRPVGPLAVAAALGRTPLLLALGAVVFALAGYRAWKGEYKRAATVFVIVASSVATAETLRRMLPRPNLGDYGYAVNSFPSGHAAAGAAVTLAFWVTLPESARSGALALCAAGLVAVMGTCSVVSMAHRPADVVGSFLLVSVVGVLAESASGQGSAPSWSRSGRAFGYCVVAAGCLGYLLLLRAVAYARVSVAMGTGVPFLMMLAASVAGYLMLDPWLVTRGGRQRPKPPTRT